MAQHRVALAVTKGAPVFELAIPCEVFGRHRDGLPDPWYDLRLCAPSGTLTPVSNGFAAAGPDGYDALTRAGTVVVTAVRDTQEEPAPELVAAIKAAHRAEPASSRCAPALSSSPLPGCWTAAQRPRTGIMPTTSPGATRRSGWTQGCCTSMTATY